MPETNVKGKRHDNVIQISAMVTTEGVATALCFDSELRVLRVLPPDFPM